MKYEIKLYTFFFNFRAAYEGPSQPKRLKITTDEITPGVLFNKYHEATSENENPTSPKLPETEDAMVEKPTPLSNNNVEESNEPLMAEVIVNEKKCKWFSKYQDNNKYFSFDTYHILLYFWCTNQHKIDFTEFLKNEICFH